MKKSRISWLGRRQSCILLLLPCLLALTLYLLSSSERNYERFQYLAWQSYNTVEAVSGYLVWSSKCHMLSMNPYDPSIVKFVRREKFEACSTKPKLTSISRESNGSVYLVINHDAAKNYEGFSCCWAAITRPEPVPEYGKDFDSEIDSGQCKEFEDRVLLNVKIEIVHVTCTQKSSTRVVYDNVHAVINPQKAQGRLLKASKAKEFNNTIRTTARRHRPLSVLILGIDSVSRLNFYRTMPATKAYFEEQEWTELRGYNKMGDNTFPNLMAILTGSSQSQAYAKCKPTMPYGIDNCSMLWYNFRDAGYATAYAEDNAEISTFNFLKVGFVKPPTDYYLRPYVLASEKLLESRQRFYSLYCTGPELSVDRIFDVAVDFSKAFNKSPYFGFFWTNTVSHENMNSPSLYDARFLEKLQKMERNGVMNDSVVIVLSDHGMRYGEIRDTFIGWYEERLPFIYVWLPKWFRDQNPESYAALRINQNRLTSPYDIYETLRDILQRAGGQAPASSGCPSCSSLFKPVPQERGCKEAGIAPHWCTCNGFEPTSTKDKIVVKGAHKFVQHIDNIVKEYKNEKGNRLCSELRLKRIIRVKKMLDLAQNSGGKIVKLFYLLEVTPGGGKFETTMSYQEPDNYTIYNEEISRINLYSHTAKCLDKGLKQYCHCGVWQSIFDFLFGR